MPTAPKRIVPESHVGNSSETVDSADITDLLKRMRPRIRRLLARYHIPAEEAEDLLQEALLATVLSWPKIESKEAWLLVTLRHKCSIYWRSHSTRRCHAVDPEFLADLAGSVPAPQEREELLWDLDRLLRLLGERHEALLRLRFELGLTPEEVAEQLGYNISSIRKLSCRSLARLQKIVESKGSFRRS